MKLGKILGLNYLLTGAVTEYGNTDVSGGGGGVSAGKRKFVAALNARLINASTGEVLWPTRPARKRPASACRSSASAAASTTTACSTR